MSELDLEEYFPTKKAAPSDDIPIMDDQGEISFPEPDPIDAAFAKVDRNNLEADTFLERTGLWIGGAIKGLADTADVQLEAFGRYLQDPVGDTRADQAAQYLIPARGALSTAIQAINSSYNDALGDVGKDIGEASTGRLVERQDEFAQKVGDNATNLMIASSSESTGTMAAPLVGGLVGGPAVALAMMYYLTSSNAESMELRNGRSAQTAELYGTLTGLTEAGTETIPLATLLKRLPFKRKLFKYLVQEVGTEMASTVIDNHVNRPIALGENPTWGETARDLAITVGSTILSAGAHVGAVNTVHRGQDIVERTKLVNEQQQRELAQGKARREFERLHNETLKILGETGVDTQGKQLVFHTSPEGDITAFDNSFENSEQFDQEDSDAAGVYFSDSAQYTQRYDPDKQGRTYSVLIDRNAPYLDWKKPLTEQTAEVQDILVRHDVNISPDIKGKDLYNKLQRENDGDARATSNELAGWGIEGTVDRRRSDLGAHNVYSVFNAENPTILQLGAKQSDARANIAKLENFDAVRQSLIDNPQPLKIKQKVKNIAKGLDLSRDEMFQLQQEQLAFDVRHRWFAGLEQLANDPKNANFSPLQNYKQLVEQRHSVWGKWTNRGAKRAEAWDKVISDSKVEAQFNALFEEVGKVSEVQERRLSPDEVGEIRDRMGLMELGNEQLALMDQVWNDFAQAFVAAKTQITSMVDRATEDEEQRVALKAEVNNVFKSIENRNYLPRMRFGGFVNTVTDSDRNLIHKQHYRTADERNADTARLTRLYPGSNIDRSGEAPSLFEQARRSPGFQGIPGGFLERLNEVLDLDYEQEIALEAEGFAQSTPARFARSLAKDDTTPGYSTDFLRSYATFFGSFANRIASLQFDDALKGNIDEAMGRVGQNIGQNVKDSTKQKQIGEWMKDHRDYLRNPGNEWQDLRSIGFVFYLGYVPKSAVVNLTQVPLVTLPVLSEQYGWTDSVKALNVATEKAFRNMRTGQGYTLEEQAALQQGRETVLEENQGSMLGAVSAESNLTRLTGARGVPGVTKGLEALGVSSRKQQRAMRKILDSAAYMFQGAENFNREITFMAARELAKKSGAGAQEATQAGINAVRTTQLEYARFNRPKLMRGRRSALFLFMQYLTQMMWLMGQHPAKWRVLMMMLFAGGLQGGIPGAENIADLVDAAMTALGKRAGVKDPKTQVRKDLKNLWVDVADNPSLPFKTLFDSMGVTPEGFSELMMHGTSRFVPNPLSTDPFNNTVDVSGSLSLGRILPGTELLNREMTADRAISEGLRQAGGAVFNIPFALIEAAYTDQHDPWRMMEKIAPTAARNVIRGAKWLATGEERDAAGNLVAELATLPEILNGEGSASQALAQMAGFAPSDINIKRQMGFDAYDKVRFYQGWRGNLLDKFFRSVRDKDPEARKEAVAAIRQFNKQVPLPEMKLSGETLRRSVMQRMKSSKMAERGLHRDKTYRRLYREELGPYNTPLDLTTD
jgi:hypothetical protein